MTDQEFLDANIRHQLLMEMCKEGKQNEFKQVIFDLKNVVVKHFGKIGNKNLGEMTQAQFVAFEDAFLKDISKIVEAAKNKFMKDMESFIEADLELTIPLIDNYFDDSEIVEYDSKSKEGKALIETVNNIIEASKKAMDKQGLKSYEGVIIKESGEFTSFDDDT